MNEFNTQGKFNVVKERLKRAVIRIIKDKYEKEVTKLTPEEKNKFLSEIYSYLYEQMKVTKNEYLEQEPDKIHEDILIAN